jgi:hypothetical protein
VCETAPVGTSAFLRGNYVEIGLNANGAFGTENDACAGGLAPALGAGRRRDRLRRRSGRHRVDRLPRRLLHAGLARGGLGDGRGRHRYNNNREDGPIFQMPGAIGAPECVTNLCGNRDGARVSVAVVERRSAAWSTSSRTTRSSTAASSS